MKPSQNSLPGHATGIVVRACKGMRMDCRNYRVTVLAPDAESADRASREILESGEVKSGREGYEYLRAFGLIQHVHALRLGRFTVRIVSPAFHPMGLFSNLRLLEKQITP